jgi:dipeptide/tripeptide permease
MEFFFSIGMPIGNIISLVLGGCFTIQYAADSIKGKKTFKGPTNLIDGVSAYSLVAMSLCLLLKTNDWYVSLLAAFLTVASKYVLRFNQKHIFNPSAFGIVATLLLTKDAWLSPGQWGSNAVIFFG